MGSLYVPFADVTVAGAMVGTRFSVLGLDNPMLGAGYVKWLLVRVGSDVVWLLAWKDRRVCVRLGNVVTCSRQMTVMILFLL